MPPAAWAYLAWAVVSVGWALDPGTAGGQLVTLLQLFVIAFFVADFVVHQPTTVRSILWVYSLSATATALIGFQAYVTGGVLATTRAAAFEGQNPEHFAAVLTPALLFGLHEALNGNRRILGAAIALVTTIAMIVSGTRGCVGRPRRRRAPLHAPAAEPEAPHRDGRAGACLRRRRLPDPGRRRDDRRAREHALSSGGAGRTDIWSVAGTIYQSSPVLGVGFANFPVAYTPRDAPGFGRRLLALHRGTRIAQLRDPDDRRARTDRVAAPRRLPRSARAAPWMGARGADGPGCARVAPDPALFVDMLFSRKPLWLMIGFAAGLAYLARRGGAAVDDRPPDVTPAGATLVSSAALARQPGSPRVAAPPP